MTDRLNNAFEDAVDRVRERKRKYGLLGKHVESSVVFVVPGRANYLFVTIRNANGAQTAVSARNDAGVPHSADLPVEMRVEGKTTWVIVSQTAREDLATVPASPPSGVPIHVHNLSDLNDVTITAAASGDVLAHNGTDWVDATNIPIAVAATIVAATAKTTPVDADTMPLIDSAASNVLKKVTWANIKATLKTYFDTLYNLYVHPNHTGDVTSVGDGATTIAANAVTYAKMQDIATDSLIGRDTAATGDPETISLNATLSMTGAGALQRAALTGDVTAAAGSNATTIANDAVTYAKMQDVSATDRLLGRSSVGAGDVEEIPLTAFGRSLIDDADSTAARTTLGLGTMAVQAETAYLLLAGRASGQTAYGGVAANEDLILEGTSHATKTTSYVLIQSGGGNTGIGGVTVPVAPLHVGGSGSVPAIFQPSSGTNVASVIRIIPRGSPTDGGVIQLFNTDFIADATNYEIAQIGWISDIFEIQVNKGGTGTVRPLVLYTGANTNQLYLGTDGEIGINTAAPTDNLFVLRNANSSGGITIQNSNGGTGGYATLLLMTDSGTSRRSGIFKNSSTATAYGGAHSMFFFQIAADPIAFVTNNSATPNMIITGAGLVGIGGITPTTTLGVKAGESTNDAAVGGVLYVTTTNIGNIGVGEDVLATYTIPANTLSVNHQSIWFEAWGTISNTANSKTLYAYFGATAVLTFGTFNTGQAYNWRIKGRIFRTGAATQESSAEGLASGGALSPVIGLTTPAATLSGTVIIKIAGSSSADDDIVCQGFIVGWDDANT